MPDFSTQLAAMIGLGVGIDYALFIVTRYREALHGGHDPETATATAHRHRRPGRAVRRHDRDDLAARHVPHGLKFVTGLAVAGSLAVLAMMIASVTLLPAMLGFVRRADRRDDVARRHRASWSSTLGPARPCVSALRRCAHGRLPRHDRRDHRQRYLRADAASTRSRAAGEAARAHRSGTGGAASSSTGRGRR